MRHNNFRAMLRLLGRKRLCNGPFLCADCQADAHHWYLPERRLSDELFVPIACQCSRCDCGAGRVLRLHNHTAVTPPKDTTAPEFGHLLALNAQLSPAADRVLRRDLRRINAVYRRVLRETRGAAALILGAIVLLVAGVGLAAQYSCASTEVQVAAALGAPALLASVAVLVGSRAPLLSAAIAAHAERYGPLTCRSDVQGTSGEDRSNS